MANKSGYFKDKDGNTLMGSTLGENVFLTDGTDLETKLNNIDRKLTYVQKDITLPSAITFEANTANYIFNGADLTQYGVPSDASMIQFAYTPNSYMSVVTEFGNADRYFLRGWNLSGSRQTMTSVRLKYLIYE